MLKNLVRLPRSFFSHYQKDTMNLHNKCRNDSYPRTNEQVKRFSVPDDKVSWSSSFPDYSPVEYTIDAIIKSTPVWADPVHDKKDFSPKWNMLDKQVNRQSFEGKYEVVDGRPRNIRGRTGIIGRGCLGRWGPNHAADPIVTRWRIDDNGSTAVNETSGKKILQFVCIERRDSGEWAIPGGMVDAGERVSATLRREFLEEALDSLQMTDDEKIAKEEQLKDLFSKGEQVYSGYVDDPRNTDNAWMETVAYNFHSQDTKGLLHSLKLKAGDDAKAVQWMDISSNLKLYASHRDFIQTVAEKHQAHW